MTAATEMTGTMQSAVGRIVRDSSIIGADVDDNRMALTT